ncbi:proline-rich protein HaeIII subfamily 1-like [Mugil cephalus]|uniref:proline-rich protein HaeIII subfamily 1-like n=1 Tax=Mugil cephalus TaxID=48193 RepID=UPI001FB76BAC|nr:proline-rich protein HaeIII subfamily 1-like [Mugil cephalus]
MNLLLCVVLPWLLFAGELHASTKSSYQAQSEELHYEPEPQPLLQMPRSGGPSYHPNTQAQGPYYPAWPQAQGPYYHPNPGPQGPYYHPGPQAQGPYYHPKPGPQGPGRGT